MEIFIGIVAGLGLGLVGFLVGRSGANRKGGARAEERIHALAEALERGRWPSGAGADSVEARLQAALERGWAPREGERLAALREAVGRVSAFLDREVRAPLAGAGESADAGELRERIQRALGALQDLDFFVTEPGSQTEGRTLGGLVQQVTREFATDQEVAVRLSLGEAPARADVNANAFMDALYLVLHNAGRFGGGATVDVTVLREGDTAKVVVRDRGPGFTEEAFARAFDPFYSTREDGLGLGLPHARRVIEAMGGRIELRNVPDGGAEVEVTFPAL